jgi:tetratricopeptide (TPR) repeat protein
LNDIQALPDKIDEYYKAILDRYAADAVDGDALLAGLFTFAAARDYLTMAHLGLINHLGDATVQRIGSTLKEVLYENPLTEDVLDYQLFHESFREYLVKEKALKVKDALECIIDFCAGWRGLEGTWEQRYSLQHYAVHAFESKREARATELLVLLGDTIYADTQKKVLKQFDATRELFRLGLLKASELKQYDQQLTAALSLVDLKYEEANDAPQVVAIVAEGDIDLALKRIESFGGADKEGVKRRFTLYMLCLMELTLLESKAKPFRKVAVEKLLNHLDEQIPTDASIINWDNFFPSYLMFLMACEWADFGLDYMTVYKRTNSWENDWLIENGPYSNLQYEVLLDCARGISVYWNKDSWLKNISTALAHQGKVEEAGSVMQEALTCARGISDDWIKNSALKDISTALAHQGKVEEAVSVMQEALTCAMGINDDEEKSRALNAISTELSKQGKFNEALTCARAISDESDKSSALSDISTALAQQGKFNEALTCARAISDESDKSSALAEISTALVQQGKLEEALTCGRGIDSCFWKSGALNDIATELAKQGKVEEAGLVIKEALSCAKGIPSGFWKSIALKYIFTELAKQGKLGEALTCAKGFSDESDKSSALSGISTALAQQGKLEEALTCARAINDESDKSSALNDISTELAKQGKVEEAASVIQEALTCARGISDESAKSSALSSISTALAQQGKLEEALTCARGISSDYGKSSALADISTALAQQGKLEEALTCAMGISNDWTKGSTLSDISTALAQQDNWVLAETTGLEIPRLAERHSCWEAIAENTCKEIGWKKALEQVNQFRSYEARTFYLKGWAETLNQQDAHTACVQEALSQLTHDSESIEYLLQKHALHEVYFGKADREKINQLNRTLNIQWALDIAAQFPQAESSARLSSNLESWLHEIADEDDRDQIELWAKQVAKGKITEEEFGGRVNGF